MEIKRSQTKQETEVGKIRDGGATDPLLLRNDDNLPRVISPLILLMSVAHVYKRGSERL